METFVLFHLNRRGQIARFYFAAVDLIDAERAMVRKLGPKRKRLPECFWVMPYYGPEELN
jgi:hypothetical protein